MKKFEIGKSFQHKKFKYGGYATLLTMIVLAIFIAVNLVVDQLDLKLDLTKNKLFSLSEQSTKIVSELKSDVKVIGLYQSGREDVIVKEVLDKYKGKSNKISVEYINPVLHPEYTTEYTKGGEKLSEGSLIVTSGKKYKVISSYDLSSSNSQSLEVENRITSAIMFVTTDKNPVVYSLQGHGEATLPMEVTRVLENENFTLQDVNLVSDKWTPQSEDVLVVVSPTRDISTDELNKLKDYLSKGGKALFFVDIVKEEFPNIKSLMNSYGLNTTNAVIYEGDTKYTMAGNNLILIPGKQSHTILEPLISNKLYVVMAAAQPIEEMKIKKDTITVEPLLKTSDKAYAKKNLQAQTMEKEAGDASGAFNIAVAVTDKISSDETKNSKLVVVSSSNIMNQELISVSNNANVDFIMNSFNWLADRKENVSIRAKDFSVEMLPITAKESLIIAGIAVILIPLIIATLGVMVWLRRRHL